MAPFCKVGFADFWLAEQLTSLAPVLVDLYVFVRFYFLDTGSWTEDACKWPAEISALTSFILNRRHLSVESWIPYGKEGRGDGTVRQWRVQGACLL